MGSKKGGNDSMRENKILIIVLMALTMIWCFSIQASESSVYNFSWLDPEKEVYVLQNRKFRKKRRVFISGGFGRGLSGHFTSSIHFQGRAGFFFKEDYGISFLYSKNNSKLDEGAADSLSIGDRPFRRLVQSYRGAMFLWSPFYSKGNFFNQIFYYDFIIGIGYAELSEKNNRYDFNSQEHTNQEDYKGPLLDLETKFFINRSFNINANITSIYYRDEGIKSNDKFWHSNWDLSIGFGIIL